MRTITCSTLGPSILRSAALAVAALVAPSAAMAGGLGLMGNGGVHQANAWYYNLDGDQGVDVQLRPNLGYGIEALLGDRNDKVTGVFRLYASNEAPAENPDLSAESADASTFTHPNYDELENKTIGIMAVGVQWGIVGVPTGFQFGATTMIGSGFMTRENLEFFLGEPGVFVTYTIADNILFMGNVAAAVRYRKAFDFGGTGTVGVRYLFD